MNEVIERKAFVKVHIEQKPLIFRDENRISFDTNVFIDFILSEDVQLRILTEWKSKNTKFFISTKVIDETFGVLLNKIENPYRNDQIALRTKINEVLAKMKITKIEYEKSIDNKNGYELFCKYEEKHSEECHINDARIVAHLKRNNINVLYSREELVRKLAELVGMDGRNFILDKLHQKSQ